MAYIRDRSCEVTGYQASAEFYGKIDLQCDFVMVYGTGNNMPERIARYREEGYVVHLMTGIAWGGYSDYLTGEWDGKSHMDEGQTDRFGNMIMHGESTPYMVPTVSFAQYITQRLKLAVDAGVEAIHVEEPEFWDRGGYSEAFKREYLLYYREAWQPPHSGLSARYKASKLKDYLYRRTIERVSSALKEYALTHYGRVLRFYVPTHSLLNYTQWKIMSPEGSLADIPAVDGFIAQVWTGTAREKNFFNGVFKERTFETSYLEYGVMQELVRGTDKKMWFLHDPIEDNPAFDWDDYRQNYLKTVTASLLHPKVNSYEICPWPNRVFDGKYPKNSPDAQPIPPQYATLLNGVFQALGDMECCDSAKALRCGILMSDTALYQRDYPDDFLGETAVEKVGTVLTESRSEIDDFCENLFTGEQEGSLLLKFIRSNALPSFYGLALPLLKYGLPVRPVLLDNVRRYLGYLDDYDVLVLSYEFMKPEYPDVNNALSAWVKGGGTLIYVGDGSDPYHSLDGWWSGSFPSPAEHLFSMLGIEPTSTQELFPAGAGYAAVWKMNPAKICFSQENAEEYRQFFTSAVNKAGFSWQYGNALTLTRGNYIVAAVLDESVSDSPLVLDGLFVDMFTPDLAVIEQKTVCAGENALLFDLSTLNDDSLRVIGCSARVLSMREEDEKIILHVHGCDGIKAYIRLSTPHAVSQASASTRSGTREIFCKYDNLSKTALLCFESTGEDIDITLE